jgi:hypothetical protein
VKLKAIRAHLVDGRAVKVGQIFETSDALGGSLIAWGKAVLAPDAPAPKAKRTPMTSESADALVSGAGDN